MTCARGCCPTQADHYRSLGFVASTTTGKSNVVDINAREKRWDKDMPAYKRLRQDGLQPKCIDGAADIEAKATESVEVEMGRTLAR